MNKIALNCNRYYFSNNNLTLSYLDNDALSDDIPVVMLHGFTASACGNWQATGWIEKLTLANRRVIALDARGHGRSDKLYNNSFYPSHLMIQDSIYLLEKLGFTQADFIGYSMGARMSAFAAINYPEKVRKLILGGMGENLKKGMSDPQPIIDALLADDLKQVKDIYARRFRRLAELGKNDLKALAHCIASSRQKIDADKLAKIQADTLILVGEDDEIAGNPYELQKDIENSQVAVIADCNHFNALSNADFCQAGINFILGDYYG